MYGLGTIDSGKIINWGKIASDYLNYRPGPPPSLFDRLSIHGIGLDGQDVLDLGTGTGVMAIEFARKGCKVTGLDVSSEQIDMAKMISKWECLDVSFVVAPCEALPFADQSFDIITANQCWLYFDLKKLIPEIKRVLKRGGRLVTSHFSWLPESGSIAKMSEELILKYNPAWSGAGYLGKIPLQPKWSFEDFEVISMFYYDEEVLFNKDEWMGRIRASRGVGASLDVETLKLFDCDHEKLLKSCNLGEFSIKHRIDSHIFRVT